MVSCSGATLMWGLTGGHEAPFMGGGMTHDSVATWLYLASQGGCNYDLVLFQPKQKHFRSKKKEAPSKKNNSHSLLLKRWSLSWLEEDKESIDPR